MLMNPHDADCVYIVPVESDEFRCTPEGRLRVYRTRNAGGSWESLERGLPQQGAYETVLRDAFATDTLDAGAIYCSNLKSKQSASKTTPTPEETSQTRHLHTMSAKPTIPRVL